MRKCLQKEACLLRRAIRLFARDDRGQELVEAALILPLLLMLLIGTVWIGRAYNIYETLSRAAREGAEAAAAPSCATCGDAATTQAQVKTVVDNVLSAASIDTTVQGYTVTVGNQPLNPPSAPGIYYRLPNITVNVQYPVQLNIPFTPLNGTTIQLSTTASMAQEF